MYQLVNFNQIISDIYANIRKLALCINQFRIIGSYPSDAAALLAGGRVGNLYELSIDNIYGMVEGIIKRIK